MRKPTSLIIAENLLFSTDPFRHISEKAFAWILRCFVFITFCSGLFSDLKAQAFDQPLNLSDTTVSLWLPAYAELGHNNISEGIFLRTSIIPTLELGKYEFQAGIRLNLAGNNENIISGLSLMGARNFMIKSLPLEIQGLYIRTNYFDVLHETNWGILFRLRFEHFKIGLGTNFRTMALNKTETENLSDSVITKIHENWNVLYNFSYYIKPLGNKWNMSFSLTNLDYYNVAQETNPIFKIAASFDLNPKLTLFIDAAYESAGLINKNLEFFGFFIKTGIIWNIWKKEE